MCSEHPPSITSIMPCKLSTSSVSRSLKKQATSGCPHIRLVPNLGPVDQNFVFDIIKRELKPGVSYRIGRFSEKNFIEPKLSFKSKVVSRNHAELWTEQGKVTDETREEGKKRDTHASVRSFCVTLGLRVARLSITSDSVRPTRKVKGKNSETET